MSKRLRSPLLVALLLGLVAGCAHRPDPAAGLRPGQRLAAPAASLEAEFILTLLPLHAELPDHPALPDANDSGPPARVYRGQDIFITPNARRYALDAAGRADLRLELEIRKPGFLRRAERASTALRHDLIGDASQTLTTPTLVRFRTDEHDPLGEYTLTLRLVDAVSGETRVFTHKLLVEAYQPPVLAEDFDAQNWLTHYYRHPRPDLALPALSDLHFSLPFDKRPGALPPLLGFYDQLLRDNAWLLPAFTERLAAAAPDEAYLLSLVLGFHFRHVGEIRPPEIDATTWERLVDFRTYSWPSDPEAPLADITQLDALWGRFFAAGHYDDLQSLLRPLANHADLGATERWQQETRSADALADAPPEVRRDLLLRSTLWSLRSNARQHPLVRTYLEWTLASGELTPGAQALLNRILSHADTP